MKSQSQRNFITGLVFTAVLVAGFITVGLIIKFRGKNETNFSVYTDFQSVSGIQSGYKVWFNGVNIGRVETVEIMGPRKVRVNLSIDTAYRHFIHKDAVARLGSEGLMGNNLISLTQASSVRETISSGDSIHAILPPDYSTVMKKAIKMGNQFGAISVGFKQITEQFTNGKGSISKLLNSKTLAPTLKSTVETAKKSITRVKTSVKSFKK